MVLFDGNSKFTFGGGQKITDLISQVLVGKHLLYLIETGRSEKFFEEIRPRLQDSLLLSGFSTSIAITKSSYNVRLRDYIKGLVLLPLNVVRLLWFLSWNSLFPWNTVLYASSKPGVLLAFGLRLLGYRLIVHLHTMDRKDHFLFSVFRRISLLSWKTLFASTSVQTHFSVEGQVLAPGLSVPKAPTRSIEGKTHFIIATVSSLTSAKGIKDAIYALGEVSSDLDLELWIIGEGSERASLQNISDARVKFWGHLENPFGQLGEQIDLLVFPSRQPESFGMVLLESSVQGIPFLATDVGHQGELSQEMMGVKGVRASDPKDLAQRIEGLLKSPDLYKESSKKVLEGAQKYSFEQFEVSVQRIFKD